MTYTQESIDQSQVRLTITVPPEDYKKHLEQAAVHLSERSAIKGFRKGKVPFDIAKKTFGDMAILQEALESIVQEVYYRAVIDEKLDVIGMPKIEVQKVAPDNDIVFTATVAVLPKVVLPAIEKIKVERKAKEIGDKEITETLDAIRGMNAIEKVKEGEATKTDKVVLDMDMLLDAVPIEGGQAKSYHVYLSEDHYIPGFNDHVVGLKKGDAKDFSLDFPATHYQKQLAGKKVDFKIKVHDVFDRQLPELSDELAKKLGQESVEKLKDIVRTNLIKDAEQKADEKAEVEILEALISASSIETIPEVLIDAERQKMFYELKRDLERNGITIEQYLADLKKKEDELYNDFKTQAEKRAKAALITRQIALDNNIIVSEGDIDQEIIFMKDMYKDNAEAMENLKKTEVRRSIANMLQNKKVMQWLKAKVLGLELINNDNLSHMTCPDCQKDGHDHATHHEHS